MSSAQQWQACSSNARAPEQLLRPMLCVASCMQVEQLRGLVEKLSTELKDRLGHVSELEQQLADQSTEHKVWGMPLSQDLMP